MSAGPESELRTDIMNIVVDGIHNRDHSQMAYVSSMLDLEGTSSRLRCITPNDGVLYTFIVWVCLYNYTVIAQKGK